MQLELCDGTLSAEVDAMRPLPEERAMEIVRQIGSALNHMNTNGICHLDVKPANMYLQQSKQLYKLGDLGLAARLDSGRIENEGDAKYMALEVMQSKVCKLDKADVFSLGASVYELIKGSALPGNGPTWHQIRKGKASISGVSKQTQKTIVSMLAHDPAQRPSAEQLARVSHATKGALPLR
jgi:wee1-like protein kinase